ncbi:MAG: hypothetical protein Q9174_000117 [Haloplaca sp. 1 TL-2023]
MRRPPVTQPLIFLPHHLSSTAFEMQSMALFWDLYFPTKIQATACSRSMGINCRNWTLAVQRLDLNDSALKPAVLALCLARIGESRDDRPLREHAVKLYCTALKEMSRALQDKKRIHTDEILAAGKMMSQYEMFHGSTAPKMEARGSNWRSHILGAIKLIEIRGPRAHATSDAHDLFVDTRIAAILAAIVSRKPSFLVAPQWRTLPFEARSKDPADDLHDLMALLPLLFEEYDVLEVAPASEESHVRHVQLFDRCCLLEQALQRWYKLLDSKAPKPLPPVIRVQKEELTTPSDEPFLVFEVSDYNLAATLAFYWATCNLLHCMMRMTMAKLHAFSDYSRNLPRHINPKYYANKIAQSVEYFMRREMGLLGPQLFAFPMGVALMCFMVWKDPDDEEEWQMLAESLEQVTGLGATLSTFLASLQAYNYPEIQSTSEEAAWAMRVRAWFKVDPSRVPKQPEMSDEFFSQQQAARHQRMKEMEELIGHGV